MPLVALPFVAIWLASMGLWTAEPMADETVNLALRRTADGLLRAAGDSTSRIPAIESVKPGVWRVRIEQGFSYEKLPALLQSAFDLYAIHQPYQVSVRRCADETIVLGYHQLDFFPDIGSGAAVPCTGRDMPEECHLIEVSFKANAGQKSVILALSALTLLLLGGLGGYWLSRRQKTPAPVEEEPELSGLVFGNSRLLLSEQVLYTGGERHALTFREAKLLHLFAQHPNQLLERDFILQHVWADEGVWVGRSVDVFVSRLRKKMAADASVQIVAVHGVGYRLETGK